MSRIHLMSASALALSLALPAIAYAEDKAEKVVVTANRIGATEQDHLGTAVTVIDQEQIEQRQTRFISDILRDVPGVSINRSGPAGNITQIRMRGSEANHTLVLFGGMDISSPYDGESDLSGLLATDLARIEILRGSQSALYGSDAIGGVINVIPRRGEGAFSVEALGEGGSFSTWQAGANAGYGDDMVDLFISAGRHETDGTNISRFGSENDGEKDTQAFINAGVRPIPNLELRALARYLDTFADNDPQDFDFPPTPTEGYVVDGADTTDTTQFFSNLTAEYAALGDAWRTKLSYDFADVERTNDGAFGPFATKGDRSKVSLVSAINFDTGSLNHKLTGAVDWKTERFQNVAVGSFDPGVNGRRSTENTGYVASYDLSVGAFDGGAAFRRDENDRFDDANTYRLQASYRITDATRIRATAGSGIKNPTNNELFGFFPTFFLGNPNLKPEKSVGWDVGFDQTFADGEVRLTATYFEAELEDEIYSRSLGGGISTPDNRTTNSDRKGVELTFDANFDRWSLNAAYTYLDSIEAGAEEIRRPPHIASLNVTYDFLTNLSATVSVRYNGDQKDTSFVPTTQFIVTLPAFTLVNLNVQYDATDKLQIFGRVENLLDEEYEEVFTYQGSGLAAYAGVRAKF